MEEINAADLSAINRHSLLWMHLHNATEILAKITEKRLVSERSGGGGHFDGKTLHLEHTLIGRIFKLCRSRYDADYGQDWRIGLKIGMIWKEFEVALTKVSQTMLQAKKIYWSMREAERKVEIRVERVLKSWCWW